MMGSVKPICAISVGVLAAIGGATVVMMMTERGRQILKNVSDCACGCAKTVGNAAEDVVTEMKDCFQSVQGSGNASSSSSSCGC